MRRLRQAKIVATLRPASSDRASILALFEAGADVFRFNFSHGSHADHQARYDIVRDIERALRRPIAVLADMQGPKLRIGQFEDGKITLKAGAEFTLDNDPAPGNQHRICLPHPELFAVISTGQSLLLDDGKLRLEVLDSDAGRIRTRVVNGGALSDRKGVNVPDVPLPIPALTVKDRADLDFILPLGIEYIGLSFVQRAEDVAEAIEIAAGRALIMVKMEKPQAVENMDAILALADCVMVARGDLGVEMPAEQVPRIQKQLIATANRMGIPIITATQMLDSMVNNPRGTRAEISDVANAILDGTDAVMLSNETAVGIYPIEAVQTMARIALETEKAKLSKRWEDNKRSIPNAISEAVSNIAEQLGAAAIIPFTKTGATARSVSKFRPSKPILAVTPHVDVARRLQLVWGVQPILLLDLPNVNDNFQAAIDMARTSNLLHEGDLVVIMSGSQGVAGSTDLVKVEVVTSVLGQGIGIGHGLVTGIAHIARSPQDIARFNKGDILVVKTTNAEYLDAIRKASAIVVEDEGLTCHAAVLGLRLDIPVIVGVKDATGSIPGGTVITLDVQRGLIYSGAISFN